MRHRGSRYACLTVLDRDQLSILQRLELIRNAPLRLRQKRIEARLAPLANSSVALAAGLALGIYVHVYGG